MGSLLEFFVTLLNKRNTREKGGVGQKCPPNSESSPLLEILLSKEEEDPNRTNLCGGISYS